MNKFWIILQREYWTRVRNKAFIISTFLIPIGFALLMLLPALATQATEEKSMTLLVYDPSGKIFDDLESSSNMQFKRFEGSVESLQDSIRGQETRGGLVLPSAYERGNEVTVTFLYAESPGLKLQNKIKDQLEAAIRNARYKAAGLSVAEVKKAAYELSLSTSKVTETGEQATSTAVATFMGIGTAFIIYMMIIIYGAQVMRGVLEEKTNRIVEVVISSVRPLQLMLGKVIGIGLVGITQFLMWAALIMLILLVTGLSLGLSGGGEEMATAPTAAQQAQAEQMREQVQKVTNNFDASLLLYLPLYFIGGFLIYGSLYAAIAASADEESDVQSISSIVIMPLIATIVLLTPVLSNPDGAVAFWGSQIPLSSPIIMMIRLASTDVPIWEQALSLLLLAGCILLFGWIAARIYRTGILMYGQKPTLGTLAKWAIRKG